MHLAICTRNLHVLMQEDVQFHSLVSTGVHSQEKSLPQCRDWDTMMLRKSGTKQRPRTRRRVCNPFHEMQEFGWQGGSVDCFAIQSGNGGTTAIVVSLMLSCLRQNASEAEDAENGSICAARAEERRQSVASFAIGRFSRAWLLSFISESAC